jgi:caffeoyl-CoA O-methyltransferase
VASALPEDGKLIACDVSAEWTGIGRRYWREAGVAHKIDLRLGPALETLAALKQSHGLGAFDFAFIDADKENYDSYYEAALFLVRAGGLIAIDNALWHGAVADPGDQRESTKALRALTKKIQKDERVDIAFATICDGIILVKPR